MKILTSEDLQKVLKEYGVATKDDLTKFATKDDLTKFATKYDLRSELLRSEKRTAIRLTKVKNDLANRIANIAIAKEERSKVQRIEKRVDNLENYRYA